MSLNGYFGRTMTRRLLTAMACFAPHLALAASAPTPSMVTAAVLIGEAGGERDPHAMQAIWEVIVQRAREKRKTPYQIVLEPAQFSCLNRTTPAQLVQRWRHHPRWQEAMSIISRWPTTNVTRRANHYHEKTVRPVWSDGQHPVAVVGHHLFFCL